MRRATPAAIRIDAIQCVRSMPGVLPSSARAVRCGACSRGWPSARASTAGGAGADAPFGGAVVAGNVPFAATAVVAAESGAVTPDAACPAAGRIRMYGRPDRDWLSGFAAAPDVGGTGRRQDPCPQDLPLAAVPAALPPKRRPRDQQVLPAEYRTTGGVRS